VTNELDPPSPELVTLRCTSAEAELIVRALRTTSAVQTAAAHRLADVLAAEAAISGSRSAARVPFKVQG
jgi:hypothetical protein